MKFLKATDDSYDIGIHGLAIVSAKRPFLSGVVDNIKVLLDDETPIIFAMNGILGGTSKVLTNLKEFYVVCPLGTIAPEYQQGHV